MFLKNRNIIFKMEISKVTDYAALTRRKPYVLILENAFSYNDWLAPSHFSFWKVLKQRKQTLPFRQRRKHNLKTPYHTPQQKYANFIKCTFVCTGSGLAYIKKFSKKNLDIHSRGKSDKNGIFDVVTSCSRFDKFIFLKNTF